MSGEDDTFDLDIYGDEENQQQQQQEGEDPEDRIDFGDDSYDQNGGSYDGQQDGPMNQQERSQSAAGQKRKAPDDGHDDHQPNAAPSGPSSTTRPNSQQGQGQSSGQIDPNATQALKLSELNWWTTEEDLRQFCNITNTEAQLLDIAFGEHKINGKSRGEAYLEFDSASAASAVKVAIEAVKQEGQTRSDLAKARIWYVDHRQGNPFKGRDSGQATKKDAGAYNSAPVRGGFQAGRGGGFQDRGRGGYQARGGSGFQGRGGYQQQNNATAFGMNGNYGGGGYGGQMAGMGFNPMMAMGMSGMGFRGGFNNMGGMMAGGRGNFNNARGGYGGAMNNAGFRGGFQGNQGFQQQQGGFQQQQGGFQQQQQQQGYGMQAGANKRPRQE